MHQIRYFLNTCETHNFTRAAELSNVSQPALTKAIRMLEDELGAPLFDRQVRPLQLTELGRSLYARFSKIWDLTVEIRQTSQQYVGLDDAVFAFGVVNTVGDQRIIDLTSRLQRDMPGVAMAMHYVSQDKLLQDLRDGVLELALLADCPQIDSRYDTHVLFKDDYVLAMGPDHPLTERETVTLQDLHGEHYIMRAHCEKNPEIEALLAKMGVELMTHLISDQDAFVCRMIATGLGVSVLPTPLVVPGIATRPLVDPSISRSIVLASLSTRELSKIARSVQDQILSTVWTGGTAP